MKIGRVAAAAALLTMTVTMFAACGTNEADRVTDTTGSESVTSASTGETHMTGDIDGDGMIEDVVTGAEDIVDDVVTGAEDIVDDIIPDDHNENS